MTVFQLGRMRHLDLLTIWHRLNPDGHQRDALLVAAMPKDQLATAVIASARRRT